MIEVPLGYWELEALYVGTVGRGLKSLAVTAAERGEGVTSIAYGLARRSESGGRRTLLVDLNLDNPGLSNRLGVERAPWRVDTPEVIDTSRGVDATLASQAPIPSNAGVRLLSAPTGTLEDEQALMRFREPAPLRGAIERWLEQYDVVIFDTSPLNAINRANIPAERISAACDGALLVVLAGRTPEASIRAAKAKLDAAGVNLLGSVLNDRFNPTLADELCRETERLDRLLPRSMARLRKAIRSSSFLNPKR